MDCDKFDNVLMDLLYEELDQLTRAAAQRHTDQCQRCRAILTGLRATRETTRLPLAAPPEGFESRVLEAERAVRRELPWNTRLARGLTIASGYAMRPQLAMAALLLLVIGSALAVLRPKPGSHGSVHVTEHGAPEAEKELVVPLDEAEEAVAATSAEPIATADKEAPPVTAVAELAKADPAGKLSTGPASIEEEVDDRARAEAEDRAYATAMEAYRAGNHDQAQRSFDAIVDSGGRNAAAAELYAAYATEKVAGCAASLPRFDSVAAKNNGNDLGHQATWQSASCRVEVGQDARARLDLENLLRVPAYAERAKTALEQLGRDGKESSSLVASRRSETDAEQAASGGAEAKAGGSSPVEGDSTSAVAQRSPARPSKPAATAPPKQAGSADKKPTKKAAPKKSKADSKKSAPNTATE